MLDQIKQHAPEIIKGPTVHVMHNPIGDHLSADGTPVDPNKLIFFSSPHKGLSYAVETFHILQQEWFPELKLYIANPGYLPMPPIDLPGVTVLSSLPHSEVLQHVREAQCVWYPNLVFPETFGLVFAEANAVGTPVITHPLGAAREVLSDSNPVFDCKDRTKLFDAFSAWRSNRPLVSANPNFRLTEVIARWKKIL